MKPILIVTLTLTLLSSVACSTSFKQTLSYDTSEPLRVAVLPFYQVDDRGQIVDSDPNLFFIDNIPGVSKEIEEKPSSLMQRLVEQQISTETYLDLLGPNYIRAELVHNQFFKNMSYDHEKIRRLSPKKLCSLLSCDVILRGKVTQWDRSYYGVETVATVGIELELIRASDGKVLFSSQTVDSESRGLSKGPTGYSSVVIEPLKGLDNTIVEDLARRVAQKSLSPLHIKENKDFIDSVPPTIYGSAHDAESGVLARGVPLTVMMFANKGGEAAFSIGNSVVDIPMFERADGHYLGVFYPLDSDSLENESVYVSISDKYGRSSVQKVGTATLSIR